MAETKTFFAVLKINTNGDKQDIAHYLDHKLSDTNCESTVYEKLEDFVADEVKPRAVITLDGGLVDQIFVEQPTDVLIIDQDTDGEAEERIKTFNTKTTGDLKGTARIADIPNETIVTDDVKELFDEFYQQ